MRDTAEQKMESDVAYWTSEVERASNDVRRARDQANLDMAVARLRRERERIAVEKAADVGNGNKKKVRRK